MNRDQPYIGQGDGALGDVGGENEMSDTFWRHAEGVQLVLEGHHGVKDKDSEATGPSRRRVWSFEVHNEIEKVVDRGSEFKMNSRLFKNDGNDGKTQQRDFF